MISEKNVGYLLLTACLAATGQASVPAAAQTVGPLQMRLQAAGLDKKGNLEIGLADLLLVEVDATEGIEVEVPQPLTHSVGWKVYKAEAGPAGDKTRWRGRWWLEPLALGEVSLRIEPFRYRAGPDVRKTATWQAVTVRVTSTTKKPDLKYLRDGADIEPLPPVPPRDFLWWPWAAGGVVVVGGGLAWWWLRRRRRIPPLDPEVWARSRLRRLEALNLPARGAGRRHAYLLSALLRRYLERKHGLAATRRTTPEFLRTLIETKALSVEQQAFLEDFLSRCDLVKFASPDSSEQTCKELTASVARFLKA